MSSNLKIKRICAWCGKEFIAQKTTTACCSKQCANALYKKKKRDEAIKANNQFIEKKIDEKPIERIKDKPFLTITETAIYLGVTRPTVYGYIKRGELKVTLQWGRIASFLPSLMSTLTMRFPHLTGNL